MENFWSQLEVVDEWQNRLSGGQKQKISIARALLKQPNFLFLDEVTYALAPESEKSAYQALKSLKNTRLISIAHRDTVTKYHDKILFFKKGKSKGEISVESTPVAQL